ncbi:MAG: FtsW/RodA/SpoVE family cell cycle protein [Phycisphaerales bacterium]|jgi:cell division protein FtsW|nr:FtsW/RodA/SpoVE family cell cycle protein [Phycisphaerales bacterium]
MSPRDLVFVATAALLMIGTIVVQSAAMTVTDAGTLLDTVTDRTVLLALAAMAALAMGSLTPTRWLFSRHAAVGALGLAIVLLVLVLVPGIGREVNGARRWIDLGPFGFQPSEIAKWGLVLFLAWYIPRRASTMGAAGRGILLPLAVIGIVCALTLLEDLGTAILIGAVAMLMLVAGGMRLRHVLLLIIPACGAIAAAIASEGYRVTRLKSFLDPWADPAGSGYHVIQSMKAISNGHIGGLGLGNGIQKFGYLPEDTTDFIFAVITEEFGFLGCMLVVGLFATLIWSGWSVAARQVHPQRQLLALGVTATIAVQAIINLLVVCGLAPTKGIALPLVSSGGTGWLLTAFMLGCMASLDPRRTAAPTPPHQGAPLAADPSA